MAGIYGGGCLINPDEGLTDCDKAMKLHLIKDASDGSDDDKSVDPYSKKSMDPYSERSRDSAPLMSHDRKKDHQRTDTRLNNEEFRLVLVGKTGAGKSATGNTILGRQCFESKFAAVSLTMESTKARGTADGQKVAVIDTPGLFDTRVDLDETIANVTQCITFAAPGPHVFLVVIRLGRFTEEEKKTVERIQQVFGQAADQYSMVLFTGGDLLDSTIEEFLEGSPDLQELVARCNGRYHVFNNKSRDRSQVTELLQKIRNMVEKNGGSHYTTEMFQEAERMIEEEKQRILKEKEEEIRREREEVERKIKEQYEPEMKALREQLEAERERKRKEREEEEKSEREEERKKEIERGRSGEEHDRSIEREKREKCKREKEERKREQEEREEGREREEKEKFRRGKRQEREERERRSKREEGEKIWRGKREERQRRRDKGEREKFRRGEREKREDRERGREREDREKFRREERGEREDRERGREREERDREEGERKMRRLQEHYERDLEEKQIVQMHTNENNARKQAEEKNPLYHLFKSGRSAWTGIRNSFSSLAKAISTNFN